MLIFSEDQFKITIFRLTQREDMLVIVQSAYCHVVVEAVGLSVLVHGIIVAATKLEIEFHLAILNSLGGAK